MAVLAAAGQLPPAGVEGAVWIAELGLDGRLRPVTGVLPGVLAARRLGIERVVVARGNAAEAALVAGVDVRAADRLADIVAWLTGEGPVARPGRARCPTSREEPAPASPDLADVAGQAAGQAGARDRRRRGRTTCTWSARRARARPCWPNGCPACCRR